MPRGKKDDRQLKISAAKLKAERVRRCLDVGQLADLLDCSVQQIYHCEAGDNWFSWPVYIKACRAFGFKAPPLS